MSLRSQINLQIVLAFLGIILLAAYITIWQARQSVVKEVESSIQLAVQLITLGFGQSATADLDWSKQLKALHRTRHLDIQLQSATGQVLNAAAMEPSSPARNLPPGWFVQWVKAPSPQVRQQLNNASGEPMTFIIKANPLDEISEVWQESKAFFSTLLLLAALTFLAVNLVLLKSLKAIAVIVNMLKVIETGQYQQKLPAFPATELDSIAKAINHMTTELAQSKAQNRALTQHSLQIQEEERQRLAQELHDELGQSLTAIKVMTVAGMQRNPEFKTAGQGVTEICDHLISVVRSMMRQLHPLLLTELGLKATLEDLVSQWAARNPELQLKLICPDGLETLDPKITIQVFRVVQEGITNIIRHAQASAATIKLHISGQADDRKFLLLEIADDGLGCQAADIAQGFGLLSIKERIDSLDGELKLDTAQESGFKLQAAIPLP